MLSDGEFFESSNAQRILVRFIPRFNPRFEDHRILIELDNLEPIRDHWWVSRLFVAPKFRGSGIAEQLASRALAIVAASRCPRAVVAPGGYGSNVKALRRWYRIQGFRECDDGMEWLAATPKP